MMVRRHRLLCWVAFLAVVAGRRAQTETDALLDECESRGAQTGTVASIAACAVMTSKCPPPDLQQGFSSRTLAVPSLPKDLLSEVIRQTCTVLFQTKCKNGAVAGVFADNSSQACQDILVYGPGEGGAECPDFDSAVKIFDDVLTRICEQEADPESFAPPPPRVEVLVSRGRPTFQSTTAYRGDSSRAVDGNLDPAYFANSCTHTANSDNPWWVVDLGETKTITKVRATNRRDCCGGRLSGFEIRIGNVKPSGNGAANQVCRSGLSLRTGETREISCEGSGRYVTVRIPGKQKILTLCEVEVYALEAVKVPPEVLASQGRPTLQSTTAYRGFSGRAVDGNRNANYGGRSCTHTGNGSNRRQERTNNPWWAVNLGERKKVTRVEITNRRDCCSKRLKDFEIRVGDEKPTGSGSANVVCSTGLSLGAGETRNFVCNASGQYVTIRIPGNGKILTLCEVQVFAEGSQ